MENDRKYGNIICVIPARGGSKGIPRKNLEPIDGKPLVQWSIEHARESRRITHIVVSSDDHEIIKVANKNGATAMLRSPEYAEDWSRIEEAVREALIVYVNLLVPIAAVVMLQPTSPFRLPGDIDNAIDLFFSSGADNVFSACETHQFAWVPTRTSGVQRIMYHKQYRPTREDARPIYHENGSIYVSRPENYLQYNDRLHGKSVVYLQPWVCGIEIDNPYDLEMARRFWE